MAHAFFYAGEREAGILAARAYARETLGIADEHASNFIVFRYGLFSVEDARKVIRIADQTAAGDEKLLVIAPERIFHEAQNALLKLFEEPPKGTTLVLIVASEADLIRTLRSRTLPLARVDDAISVEATEFLSATPAAREKIITKLLDRTKADKDDEKQAARGTALRLAEGLAVAAYASYKEKGKPDTLAFARDIERLLPILHDRSAPLKQIFEHIELTLPKL